jgi:polyisoprenyl-phosphate glycosyltransferase
MTDHNKSIDLSVVIPIYKESLNLAETLRQLTRALDALSMSYEVVLIDDGSPDDTWQVILAQRQLNEKLRGIRLSRNFGKEAALAAGLESACGSAIVVMDGDLQHPPALIPIMVKAWRDGADVVEAVKEHRGAENLYRRARAKAFYSIFSRLTGYDFRGASDFKLMDRRVLNAWLEMGERNLFFRGMNAWLGFERVQVKFDVPARACGVSSWSLLQLTKPEYMKKLKLVPGI